MYVCAAVSDTHVGRDSVVGIATCCGLEGPGIESLVGVVGSNPEGGMDVCVVCVVKDERHSQDK